MRWVARSAGKLGQDQDSCNDEKTVKRRSLPVSRRGGVEPFIVMDVMRAAADKESAGGSVIHMEVGQPGSPAPGPVLDAARAALVDGRIGYTEALGNRALRARIARHYGEA